MQKLRKACKIEPIQGKGLEGGDERAGSHAGLMGAQLNGSRSDNIQK